MSLKTVRIALLVGSAVTALAGAGMASAATVRGVVVQHNSRAHSFVVARRGGQLVSIHSHSSPAVGRVVVVVAKRLRNGTFAARSVRVRRQVVRQVRIRGVVTFVDRRQGMFTVSAGGASLLVTAHRTLVARAADTTAAGTTAADALPSVGQDVEVEAQLDSQGDLENQGVQALGTQTQNVQVEGTILAIDTTASTLTISADDENQSGQSITINVPSTIDISAFTVGQEVELNVAVQSDGSFLLQGSSEDGNSSQANNPQDQQGCQGDGPDNSCSSGTNNSGSSTSDGSSTSGSDSSGSSGSDTSSSSGSDG